MDYSSNFVLDNEQQPKNSDENNAKMKRQDELVLKVKQQQKSNSNFLSNSKLAFDKQVSNLDDGGSLASSTFSNSAFRPTCTNPTPMSIPMTPRRRIPPATPSNLNLTLHKQQKPWTTGQKYRRQSTGIHTSKNACKIAPK